MYFTIKRYIEIYVNKVMEAVFTIRMPQISVLVIRVNVFLTDSNANGNHAVYFMFI